MNVPLEITLETAGCRWETSSRTRQSDGVAEGVNKMTSTHLSSGRITPLTPIPEVLGDLMNPPALDVEGTCSDKSDSGRSSEPTKPVPQLIRDADIVD